MRIAHEEIIISVGSFQVTEEWITILTEIRTAVSSVVWPPDSGRFIINPIKKGNGVKPIKNGCMIVLQERFGWDTEAYIFPKSMIGRPGRVDALRATTTKPFVFEWETGNISSSHRTLNKMALGLLRETITGGVLVLPTRRFYPYLTDRIGNYEELSPYFPTWQSLPIHQGLMMVLAIEHDETDRSVPLIKKGTDGRALV
jgi:Restriction endonuclease BamHI